MTTHAHHPGAPGHLTDYLPAYLNGTLALAGPDAPTSSSIAAHLRECPACRQELTAWQAIAEAIPPLTATAIPLSPSPGSLDTLLAAIDAPAWQRTWPERATPPHAHSEPSTPDPIALRPPMPVDRRHWTRATGLGLIAAVLILIASVAITSAPETEPEPPRLPAIAAASPASTALSDTGSLSASVQIVPSTEAIDIAACATEPRPPGTVALLLDAHGGVAPPSENRPYEIGTEPSAEMLAAIEATLRQIVACRYEGFEAMTASDGGSIDLDNRLLALYSDRFVAEMAAVIEGGVNSDGFEVFKPPFRSLDSAVLTIQEASQWRDGSVLVSIAIPAGYGEGSAYDATSFEMRFVSQGDRWLIDEWSLRSSYWDRTLGEPLPPTPQAVQVIAMATSALVSRGESLADLVVGRKTTISVANLGSVPLRFVLPTLAFEIAVDPGHSVDLRVSLPPGTYPIDAIPEGGDDLITESLAIQPDPDAPATPELPADAITPAAASPYVRIRSQDEAIDISECTTAPRPPGTVGDLLAAQEGTPFPDAHRDDDVGTEPSAETLAGIDATLRQIVACRYAFVRAVVSSEGSGWDLDSRTFALYSNEWMTGLAAEMAGVDGDAIDVIRTPITPLDSSVLIRQNAIQLRDGSVRVSLRPLYDGGSPEHQPESLEVLFILEDGRWRVGDWWEEPSGRNRDGDTTSVPLTAPAPQAVQVVVADAVVVVYPTSDEVRLSASQDTIVSVANLRDVPLNFAFPTLNFSITIDPGHSVDLLLTDIVGIHPIDAIPAGGSDLIDSSLILWPDQSVPTPQPQAVATDIANASPYVRVRSQDEAIDIAECTTAPRPPGTVAQMREALRGTPEIGLPRSSQAYDWAPSLGWPEPDPVTLLGIEETLRQLVACRFWPRPPGDEPYDMDNRYLALFSDRYVVGLAIEREGDGARPPFFPYDSAPLAIVDIAEHDDGRVLVSLGELPGFTGTVYLLFEKQDGRWVIDDWGDFWIDPGRTAYATPREELPSPRLPAKLTVIATDALAVAWDEPSDDRLPAETDVILTIANLGETPIRFEIPGLEYAVDIAAGHSLDLVVNAPAGTYPLILNRPGLPDMLDAELTLVPNPSATPVAVVQPA